MTLRERLIALARDSRAETGDVFGEWERIALAAARMALEEAATACDEAALTPGDCNAAIRALRDGLK